MSADEVDALAEEVGLAVTDFYPNPFKAGKRFGAAEKLLRHFASLHDVELPERMPAFDLFRYWTLSDDDLPNYFEDGLPGPEAEGDLSTDGSFGPPADSDGPPTSPEDNPSEI